LLGAQDDLIRSIAADAGIDDRDLGEGLKVGRPRLVVIDLPALGE
jgi:hypothetical protein